MDFWFFSSNSLIKILFPNNLSASNDVTNFVQGYAGERYWNVPHSYISIIYQFVYLLSTPLYTDIHRFSLVLSFTLGTSKDFPPDKGLLNFPGFTWSLFRISRHASPGNSKEYHWNKMFRPISPNTASMDSYVIHYEQKSRQWSKTHSSQTHQRYQFRPICRKNLQRR